MRGEATILSSLPDNFSPGTTRPAIESDERAGDTAFPAFQSEGGPEAWLPDVLGIGATWLSGVVTGLGLIGALLCDTLAEAALEAPLDEALAEALGAEAGGGLLGAALGGGLLGALFVEECCANAAEESSITTVTRLEIRIKHLLPVRQLLSRS